MANFIVHVGLGVADLDRSARFYCGAFGFKRDRELLVTAEETTDFLTLDRPGSNLNAVYLYMGDFQLELLRFDLPGANQVRGRRMNETGLTHLSIAVADVEAALAKVVEHGGEIVTVIPHTAAMLRDPDGQFIELLTTDWAERNRLSGAYGREVANRP